MRPSMISTTRGTRRASSLSCVTITRVLPCSTSWLKEIEDILGELRVSRLPVGSSATMSSGSFARARAMARAAAVRRRPYWAAYWPGRRCPPSPASAWRALCRSRGGILLGQVHRQHHILQQAERRQHLEELEDDAHMLARARQPACSRSSCGLLAR